MFLKWRLKIRNFFKKNRTLITVVIIIWLIIIVINFLLGHRKQDAVLNTTYTPHEVLLKSDKEVPEKLQNPIEDLVYNYVDKCNNKDFSGAYELLTDDCKKYVFGDSLEKFTEYAQGVFPNKKRYTIQNYSNYGDYYIYNLKIVDDLITTGLTNQQYAFYEEKIAIKENGDNLQLCVNDYMEYNELRKAFEDDYLKVRVESRIKFYNNEIYTINITNKTDKTVVLYDSIVGNEIYGVVGSENRIPSQISSSMVLEPDETRTFKITFNKYFDETNSLSQIIFNKIRIMQNYTGIEENEEEEVNKSDKVYSLNVPI